MFAIAGRGRDSCKDTCGGTHTHTHTHCLYYNSENQISFRNANGIMQPERKILKLERHPPTPSKTAIPKQKRDSKGTHQFHGINSFHIPAADVNGNRQYSALERKLIAAYRIVLLRAIMSSAALPTVSGGTITEPSHLDGTSILYTSRHFLFPQIPQFYRLVLAHYKNNEKISPVGD